ncbi:hypothetical protein Ate01nite_72290 [Actinoplanes teichomyceticus]|nr:hypothetical protein Ate01nite_72290 [Actinoplanes teichomyceticus]
MARLSLVINSLDQAATSACATYLEIADRRAPGLVEGLYLQGSIALGDYQAGVSDIDFVAVTSSTPDPGQVRAIHGQLRRHGRKPFFDGLYVSRDELRSDPATLPGGIAVHEWRVKTASPFERNLVTWHVLAQAGVAVRGPAVDKLDIYTDWQALAQATRRNLDEFWVPWAAQAAWSPAGLTAWGTTWGVLGVARLRHTLAAARITTKTEAAAYATATYDQRWHPIIQEALRIRVGGPPVYRNPLRRRADMLGFMREALRG